jgi:hypothetical protein
MEADVDMRWSDDGNGSPGIDVSAINRSNDTVFVDTIVSEPNVTYTRARQRTSKACDHCNSARRKCDGRQPCSYCLREHPFIYFISSGIFSSTALIGIEDPDSTSNMNASIRNNVLRMTPNV